MQKPQDTRQRSGARKLKSGWAFGVSDLEGETYLGLVSLRLWVIGLFVLVTVLGLPAPFIGVVRTTYASVPPQCVTPPSGMVSWWGGDGNPDDIVGTNHGTLVNGTTYAAGMVSQAFSFDGVDDYIFVPNTLNIDGGTQATYDAWVFPTSAPADNNYYGIVGAGDSTQPVWTTQQCRLLYFRTAGSPSNTAKFYMDCGTNDSDPSYVSRYTAQDYPINNWYSVAGVFNNGTLDIYVNGALDNGALLSSGGTFINTNANNYVWIGAQVRSDQSVTNAYFDGLIDEVEIFNRALTAEEIATIANAGSAGKCKCVTPPSGMVSWWPGDGNAKDITDGNDGTLQNGATFAPGKVGQAFSFDGDDDYVLIQDASSLNYTDFTYDAWIAPDPDSPSLDNYIIHRGVVNDYRPLIFMGGNAGAHDWRAIVDGVQLNGGSVTYDYQHIAVTRSGSTGRLYVDGVLKDTQTVGTASGAGDLALGRITNFGTSFFKGRMDEVEVFNRALSGEEIAAIANAGRAGKCRVCTAPPPNMVSWWKAENNEDDSIGTNNGTLVNGATFASGMVGQAFSLDGSNQYIEVPDSSSLQIPTALTLDAWINSDDPSGSHVIMAKAQSSGNWNSYYLALDGGALYFELDNSNTTTYGVWKTTSTTLFLPNTWHHVAVTWQNVNGDATDAKLYVDGVEQPSALALSNNYDSSFTLYYTNLPFRIGTSQSLGGFFSGLIDEVEIFDRVLSAEEIAAIANAGNAGKCQDGPDLTGACKEARSTCHKGRCMLQGIVRVWNQGNQPAPRSTLRVYLSSDPVLDPGDTLLNTKRIRTLRPGQGSTAPLAVRLHRGVNPSGQYVIAVIDAENEAIEIDENNNQPIAPIP